MDLSPSGEQRLLVESARAYLGRACPVSHVRAMERDERGFSDALWREMGALGWLGMMVPESHGGSGQSLLEVVLLLEEMGRVLLPAPYLSTVVLAGPLLALGSEAQRRRWLPALAAGRLTATLALAEPGWRDEWQAVRCRAVSEGSAARITGRKTFVPFAPHVDLLLISALNEAAEPTVVAVPAGATGIGFRRLAVLGGDPLYEVVLDGVAGETVGTAAGALDRVRLDATVATLACAVGAAERASEMTLEHAKTRVQFGRPIGGFQAIAHRCVDMRTDLDGLRYLVYQAAWSLAAGRPSRLEVSAAKAYGNEALRRVFMHAHQVHGAIGFSTEHDLHLFTRRAKASELLWGSAARHREQLAQAMGL